MALSWSATSAGNFFSRSMRSGRYWWWKRGASAACWMLRPLSMGLMMSVATVVMMVAPPGVPMTKRSLPGLYQWPGGVRIVGVMVESWRLAGAMGVGEVWRERD